MRFFRGGFYRLSRMMYGRNGPDTLYYFFFALALLASVCQWFTHSIIPTILSSVFIVLALFRCFSRNIYRRRRENEAFRRFLCRIRMLFQRKKRVPKTHVFRDCPFCKSRLRLRREKGKHNVRCPRCNTLFETRIR